MKKLAVALVLCGAGLLVYGGGRALIPKNAFGCPPVPTRSGSMRVLQGWGSFRLAGC